MVAYVIYMYATLDHITLIYCTAATHMNKLKNMVYIAEQR